MDFSFKLHGQKHVFQASTMSERDGWVAAIGKAIEEAKAARDGILASDGYKECIGNLG